MKKALKLFIVFSMSIWLASCGNEQWTELYNGENLDNWETHIGTPLKGYEDLAQDATEETVFSVVEQDGEMLMRVSGEVNAAIATRQSFENYHLVMEFKWGDEVFSSRNSGLLYHSYGPYGPGLGTWMSGHELQLWTENLGDSYRMGETYAEIPVRQEGDLYIYDPNGDMMAFGEEEASKIARKSKDAEKTGTWNVVEVYAVDGTAVHVVNGETVLVNYNSGKYDNGEVVPLTSGKIQLQSEGGELFIRSINIRNIEAIPDEVMPQ
ncbi:MAG: 3-keto-disaccharide hydrolase [Candidatus Cyclobacteriaceae bacterium M3_2C_046]